MFLWSRFLPTVATWIEKAKKKKEKKKKKRTKLSAYRAPFSIRRRRERCLIFYFSCSFICLLRSKRKFAEYTDFLAH